MKFCKQCNGNDLTFDAKVSWSDSAIDYVYELIDESQAYCSNCETDVEVYEPQAVTLREVIDVLKNISFTDAYNALPSKFKSLVSAWDTARLMASNQGNEFLEFNTLDLDLRIRLTILLAKVIETEDLPPETVARFSTIVALATKQSKEIRGHEFTKLAN